MALAYSTAGVLGSSAPDFQLRGTDDKLYRFSDFKTAKAVVLVFMCNHCPYVIAVQDRINALAKEYAGRNVQFLGINSNDSVRYPADNFDAMKVRAKEQGFVFPYLWDEHQEVAKAYGAACTPEFFLYSVFQGGTSLEYQGRLDDSWKDEAKVTRQDLKSAIEEVLQGKKPDSDQKPAMGCSIKWKPQHKAE
jgi:peroxiredoxin